MGARPGCLPQSADALTLRRFLHATLKCVTDPTLVLYDGVCGLCNRFVQFILHRDGEAIFRFASLQSPLAGRILASYRLSPEHLDTLCVIPNFRVSSERAPADERVRPYRGSDAIRFVLKHLSWPWPLVAAVLSVVPHFLREWGYRWTARRRYRIFGRFETSQLPEAAARSRFLDL